MRISLISQKGSNKDIKHVKVKSSSVRTDDMPNEHFSTPIKHGFVHPM